MNTSDRSLEADTRRIAIEMGNPAISDSEWNIFFGRRAGALREEHQTKMLFAWSAACMVAGVEQSQPPALRPQGKASKVLPA